MVPSLQTCVEVIAGKRDNSCSTQECIRLINATSLVVLENNETIADSILKCLIEGAIALSKKGDAADMLNLFKFFRKANKNDKWLLAGCSQVLPFLHRFVFALLSDFGNLKTNRSGSEDATLRIHFTAKERIELGAQLFEISVDYCDVLSKDSEKHLGLLANMAIEFIFKESNYRRTEEDRDFSCAVDSLKRSASFAVANVAESFPDTIAGMYETVKSRRKELIRLMLQSSEASIQRSIIRIVSILHKFKKNGRFRFPEIRNSVSAFLRKGGKKSRSSESVLNTFQQVDVTLDDSFLQVEKFRSTAAKHMEYDSCLMTSSCSVYVMDVNSVSEHSFDGASTDWDENSFSVQHEALSRLRVPWHHVHYVEWNKAGDEVTFHASLARTKWIRIRFLSKRFENNSAAQQVCYRLQQYRFLTISCDMEIEAELRTVRKISNSQTLRAESTPSITSPSPYNPGRGKFESPIQINDTIFAGLVGDGVLLPRENTNSRLDSNGHGHVVTDLYDAKQATTLASPVRRAQILEACPTSFREQSARPDNIIWQTATRTKVKHGILQRDSNLGGLGSTRKKSKFDNGPIAKHRLRQDELLKTSDVRNRKKALSASLQNPGVSRKGMYDSQDVSDDAGLANPLPGRDDDKRENNCSAPTSPRECVSAGISDSGEGEEFTHGEDIGAVVGQEPSRVTHDLTKKADDASFTSSSQSSDVAFAQEEVLNEAESSLEEDAPSVSQRCPLNKRNSTVARMALNPASNMQRESGNGVDSGCDDDVGSEFVSKLLQVIESTLKFRKQRTRALIEKARQRAARMRQQGAEARREASAAFANSMKEEIDRERVRVADRGRELTQGLQIQLRNLGEIEKKKVALEKDKAKMQKTAMQQIGESKKELTVTQKRMAESLRSAYESNKHRRQSLQQSDNLLRGISDLLKTNDVQ